MKKICDFIARWMGVMVLLVAALALAVPASFAWIDTWAINPMLGVIMFGMGLTLSPQDFRIVLSRPKDILVGCLAQFTVMPLLAFCLAWAFMLPKELALGVILVGCCPGGTASNVITYLAKGDLALSVGMTATSTLLAPVLTPLLVWLMAGTMVDVDTLSMLMSIVYVVIAPIVCGLLCQRFLSGVTKRVVPYLPAFSSIVIALVVGIVVSHNADRLLGGGLLIIIVVMAHNLLGLSIGFLIGRLLRLPKTKCVAVSIEVGMQNSGLASSLAVLHFAAYPLATIPGAVFSVWHNISGALVAKLYQRKLFCEISPFTYWLSMEKEILKRHVQDMLRKTQFAKNRTEESLPIVVYRHNSLIRRRLGNVNMQLQENKATNLALAVKHINGLMIRPGETFSVWKLIGRTTKRKGYKEGLTIAKGKPSQGIGGGMCQLSNLIHWLVLHSELTITEHHHHDGLDLFPDFGRQIPFGTGTSISYNYIDYRFRNDTKNTYQLRLWTDEEYLCGELRATEQQPHTFHIHAENEFFSRENGVVYRNGEVYRDIIDRVSGQRLESQLIRTNHARVIYDCPPSIIIKEE